MTLGWLVGKQIAGQRKAVEKQPIAYLYGEDMVRLPALPEPQGQYAVIYTFRNNGMYYLVFSDTPESVGTDGTCGVFYDYVSAYQAVNGIWETVSLGNTGFRPIWANYDVLYADGSVYLSASDPIPVYE